MAAERWITCGNCDGVGCRHCYRGKVQSHAWRMERDERRMDEADARRKGED